MALIPYLRRMCFFLLLAALPAAGQSRYLRFEKMGLDEGLSQSAAKAFAQDRSGFIWIGTQGGLNRYDGKHMEAYVHDPDNSQSLGNNWVNALLWTSRDELAVGSYDGLCFYLPKLDRFRNVPTDDLSNSNILVLAEDGQGRLWTGTGDGLWTFENETFTPRGFQGSRITALLPFQGGIWVGTESQGLFWMDPVTDETRNLGAQPGGLPSHHVTSLAVDNEDRLWVGTRQGGAFVLEEKRFQKISPNPINPDDPLNTDILSLLKDREGGMIGIGRVTLGA